MGDGRKGGREKRRKGRHGSSVNKRRARDATGREGVCSRGRRRLTKIPWLFLPVPCPELWLPPLKCKDRGQTWALRPHLLEIRRRGGEKLALVKVRLCVSCRIAQVFLPWPPEPFRGAEVLTGCFQDTLLLYSRPPSSQGNHHAFQILSRSCRGGQLGEAHSLALTFCT